MGMMSFYSDGCIIIVFLLYILIPFWYPICGKSGMIPNGSNLGLSGIDTIDQLQNVHFALLSFSNAQQKMQQVIL